MKCEQFRKKLLEYPDNEDPDFHAHKNVCDQCKHAFQEAMSFEHQLSKAFDESVREDFAKDLSGFVQDNIKRRQKRRIRFFSVAASLFLIVLGTIAMIHLYQSRSLGDYILAHIDHEIEHLSNTQPVSSDRLKRLVSQFGVPDLSDLPVITYAEKCWMRTGYGLHLILRGQKGPVTLLFMPNEPVGQGLLVKARNFQGKLYRLEQGSFALVGIPGEPLEMLAEKLRMASASSFTPLL